MYRMFAVYGSGWWFESSGTIVSEDGITPKLGAQIVGSFIIN
jgi:hypothetical protein